MVAWQEFDFTPVEQRANEWLRMQPQFSPESGGTLLGESPTQTIKHYVLRMIKIRQPKDDLTAKGLLALLALTSGLPAPACLVE
jgi:hypothetical protein